MADKKEKKEEKKPKEVKGKTFVSKARNFAIWMTPPYYRVENGIRILVEGHKIEFVDGVYHTEDDKEIEFLTKNENNQENGGSEYMLVEEKKDPETERGEMVKSLTERNRELEEENERLKKEKGKIEDKGDVKGADEESKKKANF